MFLWVKFFIHPDHESPVVIPPAQPAGGGQVHYDQAPVSIYLDDAEAPPGGEGAGGRRGVGGLLAQGVEPFFQPRQELDAPSLEKMLPVPVFPVPLPLYP